jgi:hypothetical protein
MTPFAVGRRWRCVRRPGDGGRCPSFDFVIIGPPTETKGNYKSCRLECRCEDKRGHFHGLVQDYSHKHLKKYAVLVEAAQ